MIPLARKVEPEWLDSLPPEDPDAVRGRRDLRRINALMGNGRWIFAEVSARPELARRGIVELGAGDGRLLARLARLGAATGCDLAPRPADLPTEAGWLQGDFLSGDILSGGGTPGGGILVANLVLHHFSEEALRQVGGLADRFACLVAVEPHRSRRALALAGLLAPAMGRVTRHDMPASIRAGFVPGEMGRLLGLSPDWSVTERTIFRGAVRLVATRQA